MLVPRQKTDRLSQLDSRAISIFSLDLRAESKELVVFFAGGETVRSDISGAVKERPLCNSGHDARLELCYLSFSSSFLGEQLARSTLTIAISACDLLHLCSARTAVLCVSQQRDQTRC
jgi:hypothetical protein